MAKDGKGGSIVHTNGKQKEGEKSVSKEQEEQDRAAEEARSKSKHGRKSRRKESETEEEDKEEDYSGDHGRRKKRKRIDSKRSSRKRRYSDEDSHSSSSSSSSFSSYSSDSSGAGSDSYSDSEESESEDERHRRKRKERERKRRKEKERRRIRREKEKERMKRKKDKKKEKEDKKKKKKEVKKGAVTNSWGKYGIIRETDMWNKRPEFTAWLAEVKQVNLEALSNWEEKQMFKEFMEDHNTATFPSKKYYDLDTYHKRKMEKEMKRGSGRGLESERTTFNDEEQRRQELLLAREKLKEQEVETLKRSMQSGLAQAMKEQAQLREEMAYQYKLGNFEAAAAIQKRLDPDVAM